MCIEENTKQIDKFSIHAYKVVWKTPLGNYQTVFGPAYPIIFHLGKTNKAHRPPKTTDVDTYRPGTHLHACPTLEGAEELVEQILEGFLRETDDEWEEAGLQYGWYAQQYVRDQWRRLTIVPVILSKNLWQGEVVHDYYSNCLSVAGEQMLIIPNELPTI